MRASTLSHHLKRLVKASMLTTRGEGTFLYYAPVEALRSERLG
jgi:ArsR family transcriptional regulator